MYDSSVRGPLVSGNKSLGDITDDITRPMEGKLGSWWFIVLALSLACLGYGIWAFYITLTVGIGSWGLNNTVPWGWSIVNFVWWIGIGHAGTAFSIFLLVLRQKWRTSINRAAEAMTVAAVLCAGLFPIFHLGRAWIFFYMVGYPNSRGPVWINFNSPLFWDYTAIATYLMASSLFWYLGMIPDLGTIRDRTMSKVKRAIYGFLSFGWTGSSSQWHKH